MKYAIDCTFSDGSADTFDADNLAEATWMMEDLTSDKNAMAIVLRPRTLEYAPSLDIKRYSAAESDWHVVHSTFSQAAA